MDMNIVSPEIPKNLNPNSGPGEMSVLERQRAIFRWQQEPINSFFNDDEQLMGGGFLFGNYDQSLGELLLNREMKPDPDIGNGWNDGFFGSVPGFGNGSELQMRSHPIPRTISCPPAMVDAMLDIAPASKGKEPALSSGAGNKEIARKRKADGAPNLKVAAEETSPEKKLKGCAEEQSSKNNSTTTSAKDNKKRASNDNSKNSDAPKPDYIHVRARRGQATDSHSLAERVRREKISERMKYLQDLVPGCNKITGKAGMLDEIINYVQSLQKQVEFLSMKLAAINPTLDFDIDGYPVKEMSNVPCTMGMSSSNTINPVQLPFNALTQGVPCSGLDMGVSHADVILRRTISAPISVPDTFLDASSCLNIQQIQGLPWDAAELQNLYCMENQSAPFINTQSFTGFNAPVGHVKLEM